MYRKIGTSSLHGIAAVAVLCSSSPTAAGDLATTATCHDCEEAVTKSMDPQLLQRQRSLDIVNTKRHPIPTPVTWMHVPRTGTSFVYTLFEMKSVCGWGGAKYSFAGESGLEEARDHCQGLYLPEKNACDSFLRCTEMNIGNDWSRHEGKVVGFFRQPEVRLMSEYYASIEQKDRDYDIKRFHDEKQGCVTKILTSGNVEGGHCDARVDGLPSLEEVELAKYRVETGFSFIGLTDDWDLSICLFNTMFGVQCHRSQFLEYAQHNSTSNSTDVSPLAGWTDPIDGPVWEVAQRKFQEALDRWEVTPERCSPSHCD